MKWKLLCLTVTVFALLGLARQPGQVGAHQTPVADLWFRFADGNGVVPTAGAPVANAAAMVAAGDSRSTTLSAAGLTLVDTAAAGVFTSPVIDAPIPFNAVVPQWLADAPADVTLELEIRTGAAGGDNAGWGPWFHVRQQDDWMLPGEATQIGDMLLAPDTRRTHARIQFRLTLGRSDGAPAPTLTALGFTFIDSSQGPTTAELLAQQEALDAAQGATREPDTFPKPSVISRQVWCNPVYGQDECTPDDLSYHPVTQLIVHHTVTANGYSDSAAVVRAIWRFHNYTRGWGDIGYNYLVDLNGVLFEGHYGGDDVVGTHAAIANRGTMALSLIGTFTVPNHPLPGIAPPQAMLNAAADLLAWKADQKGINVFNASGSLPDVPWGLPNLMGHRDVYGGPTTECPGEQAYRLLPWLRQAVANRIGLVDPHIYVDELSGSFTKSNANWYEGVAGCGHNGHSYYTWSTTNPAHSANWADWRPNVPATGRYEIQVYAPYCDTGASETDGATYTISHRHGSNNVVISHDDHVGLWMSLGQFELNAGTGNVVHLTDLTTTDNNKGIWFDAIRLRLLESAAALTAPEPDVWRSNPTVTFNWSFASPTSVQATRLRVATDAGFGQVVLDRSWSGAVTSHTHTFGQEYPHLYWQVIMTSVSGSQLPSATRHFGLDLTPPDSAVTTIHRLPLTSRYFVYWSGSDGGSGISHYTAEYRSEGSNTWVTLAVPPTSTWALFTLAGPGQNYWFRTRAVDRVGNVEPNNSPDANGDMSTAQAIQLTRVIMFPVAKR